MEGLKPLVPMLPLLLPLVGKLLLMIPVIPNKAIPAINAVIATAAKYWFLAGFGQLGEVPVPPIAPEGTTGMLDMQVLQAGFFGELGRAGISLAWGCVDAAAAHFFYEKQRALAKLSKQTSWWEQGKASIWGKKKDE